MQESGQPLPGPRGGRRKQAAEGTDRQRRGETGRESGGSKAGTPSHRGTEGRQRLDLRERDTEEGTELGRDK